MDQVYCIRTHPLLWAFKPASVNPITLIYDQRRPQGQSIADRDLVTFFSFVFILWVVKDCAGCGSWRGTAETRISKQYLARVVGLTSQRPRPGYSFMYIFYYDHNAVVGSRPRCTNGRGSSLYLQPKQPGIWLVMSNVVLCSVSDEW